MKWILLVGKTHLDRGESQAQWHSIDTIHIHPEFSYVTLQNDIALIRTKSRILFNSFVIPICLPALSLKIPEKNLALVSGLGIYHNSRNISSYAKNLQIAKVSLTSSQTCTSNWANYRKSRSSRYGSRKVISDVGSICAGGGRVDSCAGDSGGPLTIWLDGHFIQVGIVSWGVVPSLCGQPRTPPGVYTNVSNHLNWIQDKRINHVSKGGCNHSEFQCPNGQCISKSQVCDGIENCKEGLDETGCDDINAVCGKPAFIDDNANMNQRNPWMVVIHEGSVPFCPGVLIDSLHVLTYKDCFQGYSRQPDRYNIKPGIQHSSNHGKEFSTLFIDAIIQNSTYNLIRLDQPVRYNEYLLPICGVPEGTNEFEMWFDFYPKDKLQIVGWKETDYDMSTLGNGELVNHKISLDHNCPENDRLKGKFCGIVLEDKSKCFLDPCYPHPQEHFHKIFPSIYRSQDNRDSV
jgi:hypothetical protein